MSWHWISVTVKHDGQNQPNVSTKDNSLVGALARWEYEGGSLDSDWQKRAALIQDEEHILQCLGQQ
jgi:hypothetical protein